MQVEIFKAYSVFTERTVEVLKFCSILWMINLFNTTVNTNNLPFTLTIMNQLLALELLDYILLNEGNLFVWFVALQDKSTVRAQ